MAENVRPSMKGFFTAKTNKQQWKIITKQRQTKGENIKNGKI